MPGHDRFFSRGLAHKKCQENAYKRRQEEVCSRLIIMGYSGHDRCGHCVSSFPFGGA